MMKSCLRAVAILCCVVARVGADDAVPTVPQIESPLGLTKLPWITLPTGEKVRIAIDKSNDPLGPWRRVYCQVESAETVERPARQPGPYYQRLRLGPVFVDSTWRDEARAEIRSQEARNTRRSGAMMGLLFLDRRGTLDITVTANDGTVVGRTTLKVEEAPVLAWRPLTERPGQDLTPVLPSTPMLGLTLWTDKPPMKLEDMPLTLSIKDDQLLIDAGDEPILDVPEMLLLARWWLNDKLVAPPTDAALQQAHSGQIKETKRIALPFRLPADLKDAKPGDVVRLQVMYSPGGWEYAEQSVALMKLTQLSLSPGGNRLRVSEPIEIKLTPELLKASANNSSAE